MLYISIYFSFWSPVKLAGSNQCPFLFLSATWQSKNILASNMYIYMYIYIRIYKSCILIKFLYEHDHITVICNKQTISKSLISARSPGCQAFQRCGTQQLITSILLDSWRFSPTNSVETQVNPVFFQICGLYVYICIHIHVYNL